MSATDTVTSARAAIGLVLADGQRATLEDIMRALRLAHRALAAAERAMGNHVHDAGGCGDERSGSTGNRWDEHNDSTAACDETQ